MIDALSIKAVQNVTDAGYPNDAGAVLLIELEGLHEEVDELSLEVESALWDTGAADVRIAEADDERERLWVGRKTAFGAFGTIAPNYYLVDGVVPRTRLTQMLRKVTNVSERYGITIANVFHAGDGNLHPCMLFDARDPGVMGKRPGRGRRIDAGVRRSGRNAQRRTRHRPGKKGIHAPRLHGRGYGSDAARPQRLCA